MATSCEFDRLFTQTVPHILEKIFLSLDFKSYMNCLETSRSWNDLLRSESFQTKGKTVFCEDIQRELQIAAEKGNVVMIQRVLSSFTVDINYMTEWKGFPLILAAGNGHKDVAKLLLDSGAEPNMAAQNGKTPLYYAAFEGHKDVVKLLLDRGAKRNTADKDRFTPLHCAAQEGQKMQSNSC